MAAGTAVTYGLTGAAANCTGGFALSSATLDRWPV
jgi:hypothetical protein